MCLSSSFSLAPQKYASNLHAERAPVRVICSFLIAMVLRHFQICHEQSSTKEPKCFCGMWSGHWISFNLAIGQSSLVVMPTAFQNCCALVQPKMMCAVSSGPALQRFHCQLFFSSPNSPCTEFCSGSWDLITASDGSVCNWHAGGRSLAASASDIYPSATHM